MSTVSLVKVELRGDPQAFMRGMAEASKKAAAAFGRMAEAIGKVIVAVNAAYGPDWQRKLQKMIRRHDRDQRNVARLMRIRDRRAERKRRRNCRTGRIWS